MEPKCYFSTDITEELSCCRDGKFDRNGFAENMCDLYPCNRFKQITKDIIDAELARTA